jgi:hypothetical protein
VRTLHRLLTEAFWRSVVASGGSPDAYTLAVALVAATIAACRTPRTVGIG